MDVVDEQHAPPAPLPPWEPRTPHEVGREDRRYELADED